jgi:hypothetical protein
MLPKVLSISSGAIKPFCFKIRGKIFRDGQNSGKTNQH